MPTKPNSAGEQQDYVPAGNGDPSGEYADDAGANVHFHVFKKPADQSAVKGVIAEGKAKEQQHGLQVSAEKVTKPETPKKSIDDYLKSHPVENKNLEKFVKESFDSGSEESKGFLLKGFAKGNVKFERAKSGSSRCVVHYNQFIGEKSDPVLMLATNEEKGDNSGFYAKGSVFYHESTHAIDYAFSSRNGTLPASAQIVLSNGKTLDDSIRYSDEKVRLREQAEAEIKAEKDKLYASDPLYQEADKALTEIAEKIKGLQGNDYDDKLQDLNDQYLRDKLTYDEWQKQVIKLDQSLDNSPEFKQKKDELIKQRSVYSNQRSNEALKIDQKLAIEFGDISDMFEACTGKSAWTMGHGKDYWSQAGKRGT
ncbi:MAG: hypothetical protein EOM74_05000, partial [Methanomicrobia archaeon]|nr:hypothetical protein [Methanomicrobia archaeon]